jgi:hypothetical protein
VDILHPMLVFNGELVMPMYRPPQQRPSSRHFGE